MRTDVCTSRLLDAQRGNVKCLSVFALDHVMRDHGVFRRNQLSRGIREEDSVAQRNMLFDDAGLRIALRDQQISRMDHPRLLPSPWNKQQMNRRFEYRAARNMDVCAVFQKSGVQAAEGIALRIEIAAEMRFEHVSAFSHRFCQAAGFDAGAADPTIRKPGSEAAVDKHQSAGRPGKKKWFQVFGASAMDAAGAGRLNGVCAIGATFVKRQSSSLVGWKSRLAEAAQMRSRRSAQPLQAAATVRCWSRVNASR